MSDDLLLLEIASIINVDLDKEEIPRQIKAILERFKEVFEEPPIELVSHVIKVYSTELDYLQELNHHSIRSIE